MTSIWEALGAASQAVLGNPDVLWVIALSAAFGVMVGAIPGLTATMAVALMVPMTFFLSDIQAIAAIVTVVNCSIFAGDIPAALVRIPGTPASAAYAADAYALTRAGRSHVALLTSLVFSVVGGLLGTAGLVLAAPQLALVANEFSSYEYFWLYVLGLTCAVIVSDDSVLKGLLALLIGLLLSSVGLGTDYSLPRLTFGIDALITGINFIPAMIGLFGISEVLRLMLTWSTQPPQTSTDGSSETYGAALGTVARLLFGRKLPLLRSSVIGSLVGALPGAGADIAAWIAYAVSKRFSNAPGEYGKGSLTGLSDASGANNAALAGAWVPALVFGIPGDSVTAIAIGVMLMKNITPGPDIFELSGDPEQATLVYALFISFVVANLILLPVGFVAVRMGALLIRIPRGMLVPAIVLFCTVGSFAMNASYADVLIMLAMGVFGLVLERSRVPLGPVVLGLILGGPLEHRFIQCMMKDTSIAPFFAGPASKLLFALCLVIWGRRWIVKLWRTIHPAA